MAQTSESMKRVVLSRTLQHPLTLYPTAVGVLGANIICPNDRPLHMLLWHAAPLMVFAGLGAALGTWLLRWQPDKRDV